MRSYNEVLDNQNRKIYIFLIVLLCAFFVLFALFFHNKMTYATNVEEVFCEKENIEKNNNPIDVENIIGANSDIKIQQEINVEEVDMEYNTKYKNNNELAKGVIQVLQEGRAGLKNVTIMKKYQDEVLISEEVISENIIKAPVERIVEIGSGSIYNSYKISENDTVYIASNSASVRLSPDENSEKICTLNKDQEAKVLKIEGDWCFISNIEIKGYILLNCITNKNPNQVQNIKNSEYSKQQLLANLDFNMDLRKPSGFSIEQFKKVLSGDSNDKNKVFENNAEYFYYAEKQYNINGIFVAAVGIHESGWGTSTISNNKKNLFGYGAVDSNPYGGAYSFSTYSEGIDLISRVFVKYYLNPSGTKIYDNSTANGKFYSGSTLSAVNAKYASDKNWSNSVYKWMQYLYGKL